MAHDHAHEQLQGGHEAHHAGHHHHEKPMSPEEAVRSLLVLGQVAVNSGDYQSAVKAYASALEIEPNETAFYYLGNLNARGLGTRKDFAEAARLFHQAELMGNERAGKLCAKCMLDYLSEGIGSKTPVELYAAMAVFVARVYPEAEDQKREVNAGLLAVANTFLTKGKHDAAAKVFRAAAEYGNDGFAQYYLAELYGTGVGVQQNNLVALYWLDCAVDNGAASAALDERDEMLDAYRQALSSAEFHETMATLASWCEAGTTDIPANPAKAEYWRTKAE